MLKLTAALLLKRPKGKRGGRPRWGKLNQDWSYHFAPRRNRGHMLLPGFHDYRNLNPDTTKQDIWTSVQDPNSITNFNKDRSGLVLTPTQTEIPRSPLSKWMNYSYHFHADSYHFIRTLQYLKNSNRFAKYETNAGAGAYEDMRKAFHLMKVEELKKTHGTEEVPRTPRQIVSQAVDVCDPKVFPIKTRMPRLSKYKQFTEYTVKTAERYQTRAWVFRAMRNAILVGQKPRKHGETPIVWANELMKGASGKGRAYEQKVQFQKRAVEERHRLRRKW